MTRWKFLKRVLLYVVLLDVFMAAKTAACDSEHPIGALQTVSHS